jgi:Spy/CpxP family protein refolding chaperone
MKRQRRTRSWRAFWTALSTIALALCAGERGPDRPGIERTLERHAERLQLDDATRGQIRELARTSRQQTQPQREAIDRLRDELHAMLSADAPELDAVLAKADEIGRAETELKKERLRSMLAIRALLTSEQRRELVRIHEEYRAQRRESRGWRDRGERE